MGLVKFVELRDIEPKQLMAWTFWSWNPSWTREKQKAPCDGGPGEFSVGMKFTTKVATVSYWYPVVRDGILTTQKPQKGILGWILMNHLPRISWDDKLGRLDLSFPKRLTQHWSEYGIQSLNDSLSMTFRGEQKLVEDGKIRDVPSFWEKIFLFTHEKLPQIATSSSAIFVSWKCHAWHIFDISSVCLWEAPFAQRLSQRNKGKELLKKPSLRRCDVLLHLKNEIHLFKNHKDAESLQKTGISRMVGYQVVGCVLFFQLWDSSF